MVLCVRCMSVLTGGFNNTGGLNTFYSLLIHYNGICLVSFHPWFHVADLRGYSWMICISDLADFFS